MSVEELLRLLPQQTREHAIIILDRDGRVLFWNAGAEHIFGAAAADVLGQHLAQFFTPDDVDRGIPAHELLVARTVGSAEDDRWTVRADGTRFWASGMVIPLRDGDGELLGFAKILRNRTDLKEQLDTLRKRVESLSATNDRKTAFLSTLSHELRNPLSPLVNAAHLLRMHAGDDPKIQFPIDVIERQVAFLRRLIDDLLDVTRIDAGKLELSKAPVALDRLVADAVESVRSVMAERRHRLDVILPPTPVFLDADAARLHQVLVNLLNNAAKYTPPGGHVWVTGTVEGTEAVIRVEDDGGGIPADMLTRIFDLFTQVEGNQANAPGGLGIGLAVVKSLVERHGGSVQVRSDGAGKGSEFTVRLPMTPR